MLKNIPPIEISKNSDLKLTTIPADNTLWNELKRLNIFPGMILKTKNYILIIEDKQKLIDDLTKKYNLDELYETKVRDGYYDKNEKHYLVQNSNGKGKMTYKYHSDTNKYHIKELESGGKKGNGLRSMAYLTRKALSNDELSMLTIVAHANQNSFNGAYAQQALIDYYKFWLAVTEMPNTNPAHQNLGSYSYPEQSAQRMLLNR